jgi:hypothetical protein
MATSKIGACEDALKALLAANVTLAAIEGPPQLTEPQSPKREHVWIYETVEGAEQVYDVTMNDPGTASKDEEFELRVGVFVARRHAAATETDEDAYVATRDRMDELSTIVEQEIRANAIADPPGPGSFPWFSAEVHTTDRFAAAWEGTQGLLKVLHVQISARPL